MAETLPIIEQISQAIVDTLEDVTTDNGYQITLTVQRFNGRPPQPADMLAVLYEGAEEFSQNQFGGILRDLWRTYMVRLYIVHSETETTAWAQRVNTATADVLKALFEDPQWGNLAINTEWEPPELDYVVDDTGQIVCQGVLIPFRVHYRTAENDPYLKVPET